MTTMTSRLTAIRDDDVLAIELLVTPNWDNAPDLRAWAREAHNHLTAVINLAEIHDSTPDLVSAEEQLANIHATIERLTIRLRDAPE